MHTREGYVDETGLNAQPSRLMIAVGVGLGAVGAAVCVSLTYLIALKEGWL